MSKTLLGLMIGGVVLLAGLLCLPASYASSVTFWDANTYQELKQGTLENLTIDENGEMSLARIKKTLFANNDVEFVWDALKTSEGLLIATNYEGIIYKQKGEEIEEFFKASQPYVLSLAKDAAGNVYAGTGPEGCIYKIDPQGESQILYKTEKDYIWDIAIDSAGALYAATGPQGKLIKIDAKGEVTTLLDTEEKHLLCVAIASDGAIYTGTDTKGILYKIKPDGTVQIVFDASEGEIHTIAIDDNDNVFFGTGEIAPTGEPEDRQNAIKQLLSGLMGGLTGSYSIIPSGISGVMGLGGAGGYSQYSTSQYINLPTPQPVQGKNAVYKVSKNGDITVVFELQNGLILSLLSNSHGLYIGTGNDGKLYYADNNLDVTEIEDFDMSQILAIRDDEEGNIYLATGTQGKVVQISRQYESKGTFTSRVLSSQFICSWGMARWFQQTPEKTEVLLYTRSGNSDEPDETWTDWSQAYSDAAGIHIESPSARSLQYKLEFTTDDPMETAVVTRTIISYLPANQPPKITSISVPDAYFASSKAPAAQTTSSMSSTMSSLSSMMSSGTSMNPAAISAIMSMQSSGNMGSSAISSMMAPTQSTIGVNPAAGFTLSWQAQDPNGDQLLYDVYYKGVEEKNWKVLAEDLTAPSYSWNVTGTPDGKYAIKVIASDELSNPENKALTYERTSDSFIVDNTPPKVAIKSVEIQPGKRVKSIVTVGDALTRITSAQYTVDNEEWTKLYPVDGMYDFEEETFEIMTPEELSDGEHTLVVQAQDNMGNTGVEKKNFIMR